MRAICPPMHLRFSFFFVALCWICRPLPATCREIPDAPTVTTLAGSGAVGIGDGPGASATFISPVGLSFGRDGTLYVADRDAQRIRSVSPSGFVKTLAGSAPLVGLGDGAGGGYRDGPADRAFFDMPSAVLAMDDGSVLVADTNNYCIRRIRDGTVSTVAGGAGSGTQDGSGTDARFSLPVALAKDGEGNVYVADPPNGIRKIDRAGRVVTLKVPDGGSITALASIPDDPDRMLVASPSKVRRLDLRTLATDLVFPLQLSYDYGSPYGESALHEGLSYFGPVAALAAFHGFDFAFVDPFSSAVRMGQSELEGTVTWNYSRALTAVPDENASLNGGAYRDGPGNEALVDEPMGIALSANGSLAISDTGNRRIRILSPYDHHTHLEAHAFGTELPSKPDPAEYRIAIVGDSYVWWNQSWHDSVGGITEDKLEGRLGAKRHIKIYPVMRSGVTTTAALSLIDNELSDGNVDMVVLDLSTYGQMGGDRRAGAGYPNGWQADLRAGLTRTKTLLGASGVAFLVLNHPGAADFPDESEFLHVRKGGDVSARPSSAASSQYYHDEIAGILDASSVPTLDLWPAFFDAFRASDRVPSFASWDYHLSPAGRRLVAEHLAARIVEMHPWDLVRPK